MYTPEQRKQLMAATIKAIETEEHNGFDQTMWFRIDYAKGNYIRQSRSLETFEQQKKELADTMCGAACCTAGHMGFEAKRLGLEFDTQDSVDYQLKKLMPQYKSVFEILFKPAFAMYAQSQKNCVLGYLRAIHDGVHPLDILKTMSKDPELVGIKGSVALVARDFLNNEDNNANSN